MVFVSIYKTHNYQHVEKSTKVEAFILPGEYYVFQVNEMQAQYGKSYSDPFTYLNLSKVPDRLIINNLELTDVKLLFTYNSTYNIVFTIYDYISKVNKTIARSGKYHAKSLYNELSFIIKTMTEFPENRDWQLFDVLIENLKLKEEIIRLKNEIIKENSK